MSGTSTAAGAANTLVLVRHGQSQANADGLFTGLLDVPLTDRGRAEAARAARMLNDAGLAPPVWFCSPLRRARETAAILTAESSRPPRRVTWDWRLAERNYGALTGRTKQSVLTEYGQQQFLAWRRSVDVAPPPMSDEQRATLGDAPTALGLTEALRDVVVRVGEAWREDIEPALRRNGSALVLAHGNSLRALCVVLDALTHAEVQALNIPTGHPLIYRIASDGRPQVRGGRYLDPITAQAAAARIAQEGGT